MSVTRRIRSSSLPFVVCLFLASGLAVRPAYAVSKEMIQLQTQIQQLQDAIARLQQSNDERMGVLKDLVQQTADSVNKMSVTVNGLQLGMQNQQDASAAKGDQLSGQVQSLNDSLDELKARLSKMERGIADIQSQQQSASAILGNLPQTGGPIPAQPQPSSVAPPASNAPANSQPVPPQASSTPPVSEMYRVAYSDYMAAKYPLATSEFGDLIKTYPDENLAGNAYFYLGEISLRTAKPTVAVKSYNSLLDRYPDNAKVPAAHLHKAEALQQMKQTEGSVRELKALIQRFPNSPEAAQARSRLNNLRVRD